MFITFLAKFKLQGWRDGVRSRALALEAGAADLVVTPRPPDAGSLPFFEDEAGRLWHVVVDPQDAAFEQAVRDFLRTTLEAGRYGEIYERAFGRMAPYDRLADLAGL